MQDILYFKKKKKKGRKVLVSVVASRVQYFAVRATLKKELIIVCIFFLNRVNEVGKPIVWVFTYMIESYNHTNMHKYTQYTSHVGKNIQLKKKNVTITS